MTDITDLIARVRDLDKAATKGPWMAPHAHVQREQAGYVYRAEGMASQVARTMSTTRGMCDAALIAYYRDACPQIAAECERLRRENLDLTASNAINESGCDRALEQLELSSAVVAGLTAECERLRERVRELEEALEPFADIAIDGELGDALMTEGLDGAVMTARAALAKGWNTALGVLSSSRRDGQGWPVRVFDATTERTVALVGKYEDAERICAADATIADLRDRLRVLADCVCRGCGCAGIEAGSTLGTSAALCEDCDDVRFGPTISEYERWDDHDRGAVASACISVGLRALCGRRILEGC